MSTLRVRLGLDALTNEELAALCHALAAAQRANPALYGSSPITPDQLDAAGTDLSTKHATHVNTDAAAKNATADAKAARAAAHQRVTGSGKFAETMAAGDETKLRAGGFEPAAAPTHHATIHAPDGFSVTLGDQLGEADLHWNAVRTKTVVGFRVEITNDPTKPETFHQVAFVTASKATITGLAHGSTQTFRVIAVGTGERESAPSVSVTITV